MLCSVFFLIAQMGENTRRKAANDFEPFLEDIDSVTNGDNCYVEIESNSSGLQEDILDRENKEEMQENNIIDNDESTIWPYNVEERIYEIKETGISVEICYPVLYGFEDAQKEEQINLLIENDIKRIIPNEINEEPREDRIVCAYMDYEIKFMNENMISILYEGMNGCMVPGQGLDAIAMATTIDLETMEVIALSDAVWDLDELYALLLADTFENISLWEGEPGIDTISGEYSGKYQERLLDALKNNTGNYHYIEWYIDGEHLVILSLLGGLDDYNEYAGNLDAVQWILVEEFCEKLEW